MPAEVVDSLVIATVFDERGLDRGTSSITRFVRQAETAFNRASLQLPTPDVSSFQRVTADLRLAQAHFKAGSLSAKDYAIAVQHAGRELEVLNWRSRRPTRARP